MEPDPSGTGGHPGRVTGSKVGVPHDLRVLRHPFGFSPLTKQNIYSIINLYLLTLAGFLFDSVIARSVICDEAISKKMILPFKQGIALQKCGSK
jgi:hypothetical protein